MGGRKTPPDWPAQRRRRKDRQDDGDEKRTDGAELVAVLASVQGRNEDMGGQTQAHGEQKHEEPSLRGYFHSVAL